MSAARFPDVSCSQWEHAPAPSLGSTPERDPSKPAEQQGLFNKFEVYRTDRTDVIGGKHHKCEYFVLDVTHDQHAPAALRAYAESCKATHPQLSADLKSKWGAQQVAVPQGLSMTAEKAAYFMRRFKTEEKLLGPNEQDAIDYVLILLSAAPKPPEGGAK